jgi:hypothetical protein
MSKDQPRQFSADIGYDRASDAKVMRVYVDGLPLYAPIGNDNTRVSPLRLSRPESVKLVDVVRRAESEWLRAKVVAGDRTDRATTVKRGQLRMVPEIIHRDGARSVLEVAQTEGFLTWKREKDVHGRWETRPYCACNACRGAQVLIVDPPPSSAAALDMFPPSMRVTPRRT